MMLKIREHALEVNVNEIRHLFLIPFSPMRSLHWV